jgi:hypothetical protein
MKVGVSYDHVGTDDAAIADDHPLGGTDRCTAHAHASTNV